MLGQHLVDAAGETVAIGDDDDAPLVRDPGAQLRDRGLGVAAERLDVGGAEVDPLDDVGVIAAR